MRLLLIMFYSILFLLSACQWNESPVEVPENRRVELWIDLHTAQMAAQNFPSGERDSMEYQYISEIASHYDMSTEEVYRFLDEIEDNPKDMIKLYDAAMDSINAIDQRFNSHTKE